MDSNSNPATTDRDLLARLNRLKPDLMEAFHDFHQKVLGQGTLNIRTKELIALAAAHLTGSPCCIEAHAQGAGEAGATEEEIAEAIFIASAMSAGAPLARASRALDALKPLTASCCPTEKQEGNRADRIRSEVKEHYASLVREGSSYCSTPLEGTFPGTTIQIVGYSQEELSTLPRDVSDYSFGCGNPLAFAEVKKGQVVLDLGSGAGIDVLLASRRVGQTGKVIGLDMTPEMIEKGRKNAKEAGADNIEFRQGHLETMPVEDGSIDWVISNCVINLSPNKDQVFREIHRVLKPGGRLLVSDIVTQSVGPEFKQRYEFAWGCCLGGALEEEEYLATICRTDLKQAEVVERVGVGALLAQGVRRSKGTDLSQEQEESLKELEGRLSDQVLSILISATKPVACCASGFSDSDAQHIWKEVRKHYTKLAHLELDQSSAPMLGKELAEAVGYPRNLLEQFPTYATEAFSGTGCPLSLAALREGQVVLDLASGPGLDSLWAAEQVGLRGKVIGLDMTPAMLERSEATRRKLGVENLEFREGQVEDIPLEDASVDVVTSNGALNLSPYKERVLQEAFRVLKPGGVLVVSDVFLKQELPSEVKGNVDAWTT